MVRENQNRIGMWWVLTLGCIMIVGSDSTPPNFAREMNSIPPLLSDKQNTSLWMDSNPTNWIEAFRQKHVPGLARISHRLHQNTFDMDKKIRSVPPSFRPSLHEQMRFHLDQALYFSTQALDDWSRFYRPPKDILPNVMAWLAHSLVVNEQYWAQWVSVVRPELCKDCRYALSSYTCEQVNLAQVLLLHFQDTLSFSLLNLTETWNDLVGSEVSTLFPWEQVIQTHTPLLPECWQGSERIRSLWDVYRQYSSTTEFIGPWQDLQVSTLQTLQKPVPHFLVLWLERAGIPFMNWSWKPKDPALFRQEFLQVVDRITFQEGLREHLKFVYQVCFFFHPTSKLKQYHTEFWRAAFQNYVEYLPTRESLFSEMVESETQSIRYDYDWKSQPLFNHEAFMKQYTKVHHDDFHAQSAQTKRAHRLYHL